MTTKTSAKTLHKPHTSHGLLAYLKKQPAAQRRCTMSRKAFPISASPFPNEFQRRGRNDSRCLSLSIRARYSNDIRLKKEPKG